MIGTLIAMLPKVLLGIVGKLLTESMLAEVLEKVVIYVLEKLAKNTKTDVDDQIVAMVKERLK